MTDSSGSDSSTPRRFLFVCVENSNRSQIAEAFARIHGGEQIEAYSAGSHPSGTINPRAIASMKEIGYDLSRHQAKSLSEIPDIEFDFVATMGCGDACPFVRTKTREDWNIPDPKAMPPENFRAVRDLIEIKVKAAIALVTNLRGTSPSVRIRDGALTDGRVNAPHHEPTASNAQLPNDLLIACSLTTPELEERRSNLLQKVRGAALESRELEEGLAYRFPSDYALLADLFTLIQLEHQCCPFLRFNLIVEAAKGPVWLELTGPPGTKDFLASTFE